MHGVEARVNGGRVPVAGAPSDACFALPAPARRQTCAPCAVAANRPRPVEGLAGQGEPIPRGQTQGRGPKAPVASQPPPPVTVPEARVTLPAAHALATRAYGPGDAGLEALPGQTDAQREVGAPLLPPQAARATAGPSGTVPPRRAAEPHLLPRGAARLNLPWQTTPGRADRVAHKPLAGVGGAPRQAVSPTACTGPQGRGA